MIVVQHNCRKTYAVTIAILEIALERGAGVVCLQEPYIGPREISHPGFTLYWPEAKNRKDIRVAVAIKRDVLTSWILEHRTDLINSTHIQCLDIWDTHAHAQEGTKIRRTRLVNIYDQRVQQENAPSYRAIEKAQWSDIITRRTILAGDFNARSPSWDPFVQTSQNASYVESLIESYGLILHNTQEYTRREGKSKSIIDLTLSTRDISPLRSWEIDSELSTPSDHEVIIFSWEDLYREHTSYTSKPTIGWKINQLCQDERRREQAREDWLRRSQLHAINANSINSIQELEREASWIQDTLTSILDRWADPTRISIRSKRWWTKEVKEERTRYNRVKR